MTASVDKPPEDSKLEKPKPKHLYEELSFMDWAFIVFLGINVISTLLSANPLDALLGTQGRNNGLVLMAFYTAAYFMITRCFKYFEYIFVALAFGSMIVYALRCLTHSILILSVCLLFSPTNRLLPTSLQQSATKICFQATSASLCLL